MSAEVPVDPAMVNARVTVTIETDATATSPATRTTVTMPHVTQVHATPVEREPAWDRDYSRPLPPPELRLEALVLRFDLPHGAERPEDGVLYRVQMHTERVKGSRPGGCGVTTDHPAGHEVACRLDAGHKGRHRFDEQGPGWAHGGHVGVRDERSHCVHCKGLVKWSELHELWEHIAGDGWTLGRKCTGV